MFIVTEKKAHAMSGKQCPVTAQPAVMYSNYSSLENMSVAWHLGSRFRRSVVPPGAVTTTTTMIFQ